VNDNIEMQVQDSTHNLQSYRWHIPIVLKLTLYLKEFHLAQHSYISKVTSYGPFIWAIIRQIPEPTKHGSGI